MRDKSSWVDGINPGVCIVEVVSVRTLQPRTKVEIQNSADWARSFIQAGYKVRKSKKALRKAIARGAQ